jgi:metal-dependent amidase/aminoacylase/carboxypeptidase family protein
VSRCALYTTNNSLLDHYVRIGTRGTDDEYVPLHSPLIDVDERVLKIGATFFDRLAR